MHIHKLSLYPQVDASQCSTAVEKARRFIDDNNIDLIYHRGDIEADLCTDLSIPAYNIKCF